LLDRIGYGHEHDRNCRRCLLGGDQCRGGVDHEDVGLELDQLPGEGLPLTGIVGLPASVDLDIARRYPPQLLEASPQRRGLFLALRIARRPSHQHANPPHAAGLLSTRRKRPRCCDAAEKRNKIAPFQPIE
jgi:hypothetical protein